MNIAIIFAGGIGARFSGSNSVEPKQFLHIDGIPIIIRTLQIFENHHKVDKIYVIRDGVIAESGTHTQLTAIENGLYANLIRLQFEAVTEGQTMKTKTY